MAEPLPTEGLRAEAVERALALDPQVNIRDLRVEVVNGIVRLRGVVTSLQVARRARELVAQIPGVTAVDTLLAVEAPQRATDAELQEAAQTAAAGADPRIAVQVADGVAILRGEVDDPRALDAVVEAVEQVPGIKDLRRDVVLR